MHRDEIDEIDGLIEKLESDEVQSKLLPGFQKDFGLTLPAYWKRHKHLSERQLEILRDILFRYDEGSRPSKPSRRYEGFPTKGRNE